MYLSNNLLPENIIVNKIRHRVPSWSFLALTMTFVVSGCQTTLERQRLLLDSYQFPASSLTYYEEPSTPNQRQFQTITGSYNGKLLEAAYIKAKDGYVWLRKVEELPVKSLKTWNKWKNTDIRLGSYNKIRTSLAELQYRRFKHLQRDCVFFGRSFGWTSLDDTQRPTKTLNGYFCEQPNVSLDETDIADLLQGLTLVRTAQPIASRASTPSITKIDSDKSAGSKNNPSMHRSLVGSWAGVSDNLTGSFSSDSSVNKGRLKVILEKRNSVNTICSGQWLWAKGKYNSVPLPQGTWSIACDDGLTAGGTYVSSAPNIGTIEGVDAKGRTILMEFKPESQNGSAINSAATDNTIEKRLLKLKSLVDEGLLTEKEAEEKRREILDGL